MGLLYPAKLFPGDDLQLLTQPKKPQKNQDNDPNPNPGGIGDERAGGVFQRNSYQRPYNHEHKRQIPPEHANRCADDDRGP
jgi:hypothetical protein